MNHLFIGGYLSDSAPAVVRDFKLRNVGKTSHVTIELVVTDGYTLSEIVRQLHELKASGGKQ